MIVCGETPLDAEGAAYLQQLQTRFKLPIAYEQVVAPMHHPTDGTAALGPNEASDRRIASQ
jgi:hypothetical protein